MRKVWGISYKLKKPIIDNTWTGPCGIFFMSFGHVKGLPTYALLGRPVFFKTRNAARIEAAKHTGVQTKVEKYELTWKKAEV